MIDLQQNSTNVANDDDTDSEGQSEKEYYTSSDNDNLEDSKLLGDWVTEVKFQSAKIQGAQRFGADGSYKSIMINTYEDGSSEKIEEEGTYVDHGTYFEFHTNQGDYDQRYRIQNGSMMLEFVDLNTWFQFERVQ